MPALLMRYKWKEEIKGDMDEVKPGNVPSRRKAIDDEYWRKESSGR